MQPSLGLSEELTVILWAKVWKFCVLFSLVVKGQRLEGMFYVQFYIAQHILGAKSIFKLRSLIEHNCQLKDTQLHQLCHLILSVWFILLSSLSSLQHYLQIPKKLILIASVLFLGSRHYIEISGWQESPQNIMFYIKKHTSAKIKCY